MNAAARRACTPLVTLLAATQAAAGAAQAPQLIEGRLGDGDPREQAIDNAHTDYQRVRLEAGRRYRISVGSSYFYPVISFHGPDSIEALVQPDNYRDPGDRGPRIVYTPAASGDYELTIRADGGEGEGSYAIGIETLPPLPPPHPARGGARLELGWQAWEGELESDDPDRDGYPDYRVTMRAGETRVAIAESEAFLPVLWVAAAGSPDGDPVDAAGTGGVASPAIIAFRAPRDGDYIFRIATDASGGTGRYRLRISDPLTPPPLAPPGEPSAASGD